MVNGYRLSRSEWSEDRIQESTFHLGWEPAGSTFRPSFIVWLWPHFTHLMNLKSPKNASVNKVSTLLDTFGNVQPGQWGSVSLLWMSVGNKRRIIMITIWKVRVNGTKWPCVHPASLSNPVASRDLEINSWIIRCQLILGQGSALHWPALSWR